MWRSASAVSAAIADSSCLRLPNLAYSCLANFLSHLLDSRLAPRALSFCPPYPPGRFPAGDARVLALASRELVANHTASVH
ncbi:unnamed protein product [Schistocephalus solidus]|uniref:Secreted protein n=1 Tax=Schistocephalus solidus TaxID=70667 RepID=A0A183SN04_SCHSO|nr:unnamed protein product [Schistocephalus solidus]